MVSDLKLFWTETALKNLEEIIDYIGFKWTEKEVQSFTKKLSKQIDLIQSFPNLFPATKSNPNLRKSVLSRQTSIFYELKDEMINILYVFDTRQDPEKIE